MARKKKEEPVIIPNEYGIIYNGSFLYGCFDFHKSTKTYKLNGECEGNLRIAKLSSFYAEHQYSWLKTWLDQAKEGLKLLTFASPMIAKIWLVSHSSYPSSTKASWFLTESELDLIINKKKYGFRRFKLDKNDSKPLLCEFQIVKIEKEEKNDSI